MVFTFVCMACTPIPVRPHACTPHQTQFKIPPTKYLISVINILTSIFMISVLGLIYSILSLMQLYLAYRTSLIPLEIGNQNVAF